MVRMEVTISPVEVMYVEAKGGLSGVREAWSALESKLPSLKRRKFYGTYHDDDKVYRACTAIMDEKEPEKLGLSTWTIPGGKFVRKKIVDYASRVEIIGETFESMAQEYDPDPNRPSIEFYRSQREIILLFPIL